MKDNSEMVTLKEYVEFRFNAIEKATSLALASMDKRLDQMNEFRNTLKDQAAKFITREELGLIVSRLEQDIKNLETAKSQMLSITAYDAAHKDLENQVEALKLSAATLNGKATQESVRLVADRAQWAIIFSAIGSIIAIVGFISRITGH